MRMYLIPAALAATLSVATLALAAPQHATGTVKTFDSKAMTLTLADGSTYLLPGSFKNPGLKAGEKVSIAWDMNGKHRTAETVTIMK
jgi:hypothetical protein